MALRTLYTVLELQRPATTEEIKAAYRRMALRWHPDRNKSRDAPERFREINDAYRILMNPAQRAYYDQEIDRIEFEYQVQEEVERRAQAEAARSHAPQAFADLDAQLSLTPEMLIALFARIDRWLRRRFAV
jgi:DnaJ-class molecular chaperone